VSIEILNDLSLRLVADDFSGGHRPSQPGPTKTSRALAIIHLAAHDAYAMVTTAFAPKLGGLPPAPGGGGGSDADGTAALLGAGYRAARILYPDFGATIDADMAAHAGGFPTTLLQYGEQIANAWLADRSNDGSAEPTEDLNYAPFPAAPGKHRPDPFNPSQTRHGPKWGAVRPFVIASVSGDAPLGPPPDLNSTGYAADYDQVFEKGSSDLTERDEYARRMAAIGIFWGYDGANKLGTPPRLYNQVVREIPAVKNKTVPHDRRVRLFAAINAAMADAGIAAWHWKYVYDLWRPVLGVREADKGFGPTGQGDGSTQRNRPGNPFWRPLGAPRSNPFPPAAGAPGANFTPNFPSYPSGHATFGAACFETAAGVLGTTAASVAVTFVSDEFNGTTTDNTGAARPRWEQTFTLKEGIEQNSISRVSLGVHWEFDASAGELVGRAVAAKAVMAFT
jgi:hypothetical protein